MGGSGRPRRARRVRDDDGARARAVRRLGVLSLLSGVLPAAVVGAVGLVEPESTRWIVVGVATATFVVGTVVLKRQVWGPDFETSPDRSDPLWRVNRVTRTGSFTSALMVPVSFLFRADMAGSTVLWLAAAAVVAAPAVATGCWALRQQASARVDG